MSWEPGLYPGVPFNEYLAIPAINASTLKLFEKSAAHARQEMLVPKEPTKALDMGNAIHAAILEPHLFKERYIRAPKRARRSNADKAWWVKFLADNEGKEVLKDEDYAVCEQVADAVWLNPTAAQLLTGEGQNEVVAVWEDKETGLLCKGRQDRIGAFDKWTVVTDIKSTRDAGSWFFGKDTHTYGYHTSAAYYLDGLKVLAPAERRFVILAVEKNPPFCSVAYELDKESLKVGRRNYRRYLHQYARAKDTGKWPGYPTGINPLTIPSYAKGVADMKDLNVFSTPISEF